MRWSRLTISTLFGTVACLAAISCATTASAGPPKINDSESSSWVGDLWPSFSSWKLPSLPLPKATTSAKTKASPSSDPNFAESTQKSLTRTWKSVQRSTRSAWESTKYALRPYDTPTKSSKRSTREAAEEGGFWSGLFGSNQARQSGATVNDFLRQPTPY